MYNTICAGALAALGIISMSHAAAQQSEAQQVTQSVTIANYKKASPWFRAESQHFIVYADTKREATTELLNNLERLDFLLRIYTKPYRKANSSDQKLTFYYQNRVEGLNTIDAALPADAIGLYSSCASGVQGFGFHLGETSQNEGLSYIFEAYTRHFIYRHTDIRSPAAFIDGFAQYFASVRFTDTQMSVGKTPLNVALYLDFLEEGNRYSLDYTDVLAQRIANAKNYAGDAGVRLEFAAKSWVLMHYMLSSEENRDRLGKYLNSVYQGKEAVPAFEGAFDLKATQLGTEMWRYRRTSIKVLQVDVPDLPKATVNFTALPQAATNFVLLDAAVKSCPGKRAGEALLNKIASEAGKFPKNEYAQMTLSRARIAFGNPQEALPWLTQAIAKNAGDFDAAYLSGLANLRLAEQTQGAGAQAYLQRAQQQLLNARELNPESPDAAYAYFRAELLGRSELSETALEGALTAWRSAREVGAFARSAALTHAYLGNTSQAKILLKTLTLNTLDPQTASWANTWQQKMAAGASRDDILAEMRTEQAAPTFKEWTIDTSSVMATVRYNAGVDAAQNYFHNQTINTGSPDKAVIGTPTKR
jgi:hypothetical protein